MLRNDEFGIYDDKFSFVLFLEISVWLMVFLFLGNIFKFFFRIDGLELMKN